VGSCTEYFTWRTNFKQVYDKFVTGNLTTTTTVKVAILDTGIDATHPDVRESKHQIKAFKSWLTSGDTHDSFGHGTHIAGLLLELAPDAELYIAKIAEDHPSDPSAIAEVCCCRQM
jgi:subtilisin family serine protease